MDEEEDWTALLDLFLPPTPAAGRRDDAEPADDAPWRTRLWEAARQAAPRPRPPAPARTTPRPPTAGPAPSGRQPPRQKRRPGCGDSVALVSLAGLRGRVLAINGEWALVQTAAARIRARCADLEVVSAESAAEPPPARTSLIRSPQRDDDGRRLTVRGGSRGRLGWQGIDLHGMTPADALERLDDFLFSGWQQGWDTVAVVHGKGTGALRSAVRALLAAHPAVHHILGAAPRSGGDGVTLVQLRRKSDLFEDMMGRDRA